MLTAFVVVLVLFAISFVLAAPTLVRLFQRCPADEITAEWLENFSVSSYYPMEGLLAEEDFRFLASQPGFDLSLYKKLRRERMLIFKQYLGRLMLDFNRLHCFARMLIAQSNVDQSEVLGKLFSLKLRFTLSVLRAEFSYYSCSLGLSSLAAQSVVARLEEMSLQLSALALPTVSSSPASAAV